MLVHWNTVEYYSVVQKTFVDKGSRSKQIYISEDKSNVSLVKLLSMLTGYIQVVQELSGFPTRYFYEQHLIQ